MSGDERQPYFYGRSAHRINAKGQVAVPARFRAVLSPEASAQGLVLIRGEAPCIYCYTHAQFQEVIDRLNADPEIQNDEEFLREFYEEVYPVDTDGQGRIVIHRDLRDTVGISGPEVVFIGHNERIEIWDAETRREAREARRDAYEEKRARLARRIFGP